MRLAWLCFLLVGAFALNRLRHHEAEYLAPSLIESGIANDVNTLPPTCDYRVDDSEKDNACPRRCVPPDHTPTYPRTHYSLDGSCPTYRTIEPCPSVTLCAPDEWPEQCRVTFGEWSECSATCGGGQQERRRSLPLACLGCHYCDVEYRSCNVQPCGRDCVKFEWNDWGPCSVSCVPTNPVPATQTRTRQIIQGLAPGLICDPSESVEVRSCQPAAPQCSVDCGLSDWTPWGSCSASCGCGVAVRTRSVVTQPAGYGAPCSHLTETKSCSCGDCPQKCEYSEWSYGACTGDCYLNYTIDGDTVIEYPERRKVRYILREAKGGEPSCNNPCELAKTEPCKSVPPCPEDCKLSPWGPWTGECPSCLTPGQPVPVQTRERAIISLGNGICGCTRQERVCDVPWCCEDCIVGNFTEWGPCVVTSSCVGGKVTGVRIRTREVLRPANRCGASCPSLEETETCEQCCPVDCEVGAWTGWLSTTNQCGKLVNGVPVPIPCGTERGIIRWTRAITKRPNECGAPCPDTEKTVDCFPPASCCPVNCTLGEPEYSDCYGCGANARRWEKKIVLNYESCGGIPCCYYGGCALFRPVSCPNPPSCPQTPCVYGEWGNYSACSATCAAPGVAVPSQCRQRHLINQPTGEVCPGSLVDCVACNDRCCPKNCEVGPWGDWGNWEPSCGLQVRSRSRPIINQAQCGGSPCPPVVQHDTQTTCCPVDCVVDEWGPWSLCPSCVQVGDQPSTQVRKRVVLIQNGCGGSNCPTELTQTRTCPATPCDRNCIVSEWSDWSECPKVCGDSFQVKRRNITTTPLGYGMACPPLVETRHCRVDCPTCIKGEVEYGPCEPSCTNVPGAVGHREVIGNHKPLYLEDENGTKIELQMCDEYRIQEPCSIPCCPVDCVMTPWSSWSECVDGVKSRTRSVKDYPVCGGAACPVCLFERDTCDSPPIPGECEFGEACEEGIGSFQDS